MIRRALPPVVLAWSAAAFLMPASAPGTAFAQEPPGTLASQRPVTVAKPVPLPWRDLRWPSLDYHRHPIKGGGALYTLKGDSGRKFRIDAVFEIGAFTLPREKRPLLTAAMDLILLGGAGQRSFEQIQRYVLERGLQIDTRLTHHGYMRVTVSGLTEDFAVGLALLEDMLLRPRFDRDALEQWKQEQMDAFNALLDASSSGKQQRFLEQEAARMAFGDDHYYAHSLKRLSRRTIEAIRNDDVIAVTGRLINRSGLTLLLSGSFADADQAALRTLGERLPRKDAVVFTWFPERPASEKGPLRATIIRKADMAQCTVTLRHYFPNAGRLNAIERTRMALLSEIFSATGGVVGNDRFSKALRAESGLSYSPHATFDDEAMEPNTNVALWRMNFQSANEKVGEAVALARRTWEEFASKGVTPEELERARVSRMNTVMAREPTIFDKADGFLDDVLARAIPNPVGLEDSLLRLEMETDARAVNATLARLVGGGTRSALVVMGNPTREQMARLTEGGGVEIVRDVPFETLVKELTQGR